MPFSHKTNQVEKGSGSVRHLFTVVSFPAPLRFIPALFPLQARFTSASISCISASLSPPSRLRLFPLYVPSISASSSLSSCIMSDACPRHFLKSSCLLHLGFISASFALIAASFLFHVALKALPFPLHVDFILLHVRCVPLS